MKNGTVIYKAFDNDYFGALDVTNSGFSITNNLPGPYLFSDCDTYRIFGGMYSFSSGSLLKIIGGLPPHFQFRLILKVFFIDSWDNESFNLYIDGNLDPISQQNRALTHTTNLCGYTSWNEEIMDFSIYRPHTTASINIRIESTLNQVPCDESFGISQFYVVLDRCESFCDACSISGCTSCFPGYFLHSVDMKCYLICPSGFYGSATVCLTCPPKCLTCDNSGSCSTCVASRIQNPPNCDCPIGFFHSGSIICEACLPSCETCNLFRNTCVTCAPPRTLKPNS